MSIGRPLSDFTTEMNSLYKITLDMSGWDKTAIQVSSPVVGAIFVYASNNGNFINGLQQGDAKLAIDFMPIQAVNLATGVATNTITAAGLYRTTIDAQYLRLQGNPTTGTTITNVYKILLFNSKID